MKDILLQQYDLVKSSRATLLDFCASLPSIKFIEEVNGFGRGGSVRNLLVHINDTYQYWTAVHCLDRHQEFRKYDYYATIEECRGLFDQTDQLVIAMLHHFENNYDQQIISKNTTASPFKVFTHVITHEFHHKGQILSISRHLGFVPVDTDIIR